MSASPPQELSHRHHAIIDHMLSFPEKKLGEIAEDLGYSAPWLSTIVNSHAFQVEFQTRREAYNQQLNEKTQRRMFDVALKAADKMEEVLDEEGLEPNFVLDSFDKTLKNLGFGGKAGSAQQGPQQVQNNFFAAHPDDLARARERMSQHHGYGEAQGEEAQGADEASQGAVVEGEYHSKEDQE